MKNVINWPNTITIGRVALCMFCLQFGASLGSASSIILFAVFVLSFWPLDSLDGFVARKLNQQTKFGAALDYSMDRALDCLCAVAVVAIDHRYASLLSLFFVCRIVPNCIHVEIIKNNFCEFAAIKHLGIGDAHIRATAELYQGVRALFFGGVIFLNTDLYMTIPFAILSIGYAALWAFEVYHHTSIKK